MVMAIRPEPAECRSCPAGSLYPGEEHTQTRRQSNWQAPACEGDSRLSVSCHVSRRDFPTKKSAFQVGMKLEGIDPSHPNMFCVMTVAEVTTHRRTLAPRPQIRRRSARRRDVIFSRRRAAHRPPAGRGYVSEPIANDAAKSKVVFLRWRGFCFLTS